jgi:hypothetical protein
MKTLTAVTLLLLAACAGRAPRAANPALELWRHYEPGAPAAYALNPYLNNILGIYLLQEGSHTREIAAYIQWYCDRLNYPDKHGVTGSIYDFYITREGVETAGRNYDSVDSYAATFLILLQRYYAATGDAALMNRNWAKIKDVAFTIAFLQDKDGLVRALPASGNKYLMDNCECYDGLRAYQELAAALGHGRDPYYETVAAAIKKGVLGILYDTEGGFFHWGMADGVKTPFNAQTLYPDALSQIFPFLHGVSSDAGALNGFLESYKSGLEKLPLEQRLTVEMARRKVKECSTGSGATYRCN